ncbi:DUF4126 family protein [Fibrella sp. HMF5335]|uniref:DUF4126 family protein n=1 Tax=Fibrella rubiginis TaxID=2817060 RepID=A0A939GFB8_9BACT|nr:DUF4126 family protein [Fibrella rubiginis]MBO0936194.1 DUF4126 family protein [Fibrella rubiginis]
MKSSPLSAFSIGVVSGMRAFSGPALVSQKLSAETPNPLFNSRLAFMASPKVANVFKVLAGGELIGDKIPHGPDRISPPQLIARLASGATSGAVLSEARGASVRVGALLGAAGALAGAFAFFHLRRYLNHDQDVPDPLLAVIEDAITYGAGWAVVK